MCLSGRFPLTLQPKLGDELFKSGYGEYLKNLK